MDGEELLNIDMDDEIVMHYPLQHILTDKSGQTQSEGEADAVLDKEQVQITPNFGEPLYILFTNIHEISYTLYRITLKLISGDKLELSGLGYNYENFLKTLFELRNEKLIEVMLMDEKVIKSKIPGTVTRLAKDTNAYNSEECSVYLYETGMVITVETGYPVRIPYSLIVDVREEKYKLIITLESSEQLTLSQMGTQFDIFKKTLSDLTNKLLLRAQQTIKDMFPRSDGSVIFKASRLMKDGKASKVSDLKSISAELWNEIEAKVKGSQISEEYGFLKTLGQEEKIAIGLKRGLLGSLTGDYIWFLIPIYSIDAGVPGNAVAVEAVSSEGGGRATYFFRIMSRKDYCSSLTMEQLEEEVDKFIRKLNFCMLSINFRREPIYMEDKKLQKPEYSNYRIAVEMIPELKILRELFIGRVIHSNGEQWKSDAMQLLKFNVDTQDDSIKWKRNIK